jgi:hypothetical protein
MPDHRRLSLAAYRTKGSNDAELSDFFAEEVATLRARGHITTRPAPICRTEAGEYLVVIEWQTPRSVDEAHADAVIVELWARKADLVEYIGIAELARSAVPFVSYDVVADA